MYSSTELIRKSKTIFNKIISEEIDKAIIMRDGKPSFILLDFDKYEKIMAEYDILKANHSTHKKTTKPAPIKKEVIAPTPKVVEQKVVKKPTSQVVPPKPTYVEEDIVVDMEELNETILETKIQTEIEHEKEVKEGLEVLDNLDFDDEFKEQVEKKVKLKREMELNIKNAKQKEAHIEQKKQELKDAKPEISEFWS